MKRIAPLTLVCLASIATGQTPRVRDSAGVRIVENGPRLTAPVVFQLADKPSFDVGGLQQDPSLEFATMNSYLKGIRLSNGNVAVIDKTRLQFFDAAGKRLKVVGRAGQGPGEYQNATDICTTRRDTIIVGQFRNAMHKYTGDGEYVATYQPPNGGFTNEGQICFDDGTFVLHTMVGGGRGAPLTYEVTRARFGEALSPVIRFSLPPYDMLVRPQFPEAAFGQSFYKAAPDAFEIRAYDPTGKLRSIIRTSDVRKEITGAERNKLASGGTGAGIGGKGAVPAGAVAEANRRAIENSTTKYWPAFGQYMMVDRQGRIWAQDWAARSDPTVARGWTAFDSTGRLLGRLIIPGAPSEELRHQVVSFGNDEVFLMRVDEDGARHIAAFPIRSIRR